MNWYLVIIIWLLIIGIAMLSMIDRTLHRLIEEVSRFHDGYIETERDKRDYAD